MEKIQREAQDLKKDIIKNLIENIEDQSQADTIVEYASYFDMNRELSLEERVELLKNLHAIYCIDYEHAVEDQGEYGVHGWDVTVTYKKKIDVSLDNLSSQLKKLWPKMNKEWLSLKAKKKPHHLDTKDFWKHMIEQFGYLAPELFELINILFSISPGTGPLERSYSKLEKICKKDRNNLGPRSIENLWLLAIYQLKDDDSLFDEVRKYGRRICKV